MLVAVDLGRSELAESAVEIPVVVVDRQGRFVTGLHQSDFAIYEDGKRQTISAFTVVAHQIPPAVPVPASTDPVAADVETNATPFEGRLYVLLIDDLHIDPVHTIPTRELAGRFVETQLNPGDLAAVVCTSGRSSALQNFTSNRRLLMAAINQAMGRRPDSPTGDGDALMGRSPGGAEFGGQRRHNAVVTLSAVRARGLRTGRRSAVPVEAGALGAPHCAV